MKLTKQELHYLDNFTTDASEEELAEFAIAVERWINS